MPEALLASFDYFLIYGFLLQLFHSALNSATKTGRIRIVEYISSPDRGQTEAVVDEQSV